MSKKVNKTRHRELEELKKLEGFYCIFCGLLVYEGESQGFDFDMCQDCWDSNEEFRIEVGRD